MKGSLVPKLAIFDRDGTLIDFVRDAETGLVTTAFHPKHIRLLDGVVSSLSRLVEAGYMLAIATNQPGPAKGHFAVDAVVKTNTALAARLAEHGVPIARIEVCLHHPAGGEGGAAELIRSCECRKPKPGMLLSAMAALGAGPEGTWMIGDSMADIDAGRAAGVRTALLLSARCELCPLKESHGTASADRKAAKLDELVRAIIEADDLS